MYKIIKIAIVSVIFTFLTGCDSEFTSSIKKSEYSPYNRTIEEIFEKTEYCSAVEWDEIDYKNTKLLRVACLIKEEERLYPDIIYLVYHFKLLNDTVQIHNAYYGDKDKKVCHGNKGKITNREAHTFLRYSLIDKIK